MKKNKDKEKNINKEEEPKKEMGFFKTVWYSIDKIEKYSDLSARGFKKAIKYLVILVIFVTLASSYLSIYRIYSEFARISEYIEEYAPEFQYKDKNLVINSDEAIIANTEKFGKIIADTNEKTEEEINAYINSIKDEEKAIIILRNKMIIKQYGTNEKIEYNYEDLFKQLDMNEFNKETLIQKFKFPNIMQSYFKLFLLIFVYDFGIQLINLLFYIIVVSIVGFLTSIVLRLKLKYKAIFNMGVYSITLSTLLYIIYLLVNIFTNYSITYFEVMFMLISNIYMIAALFILKSEFNKKQEAVQKVIEVEKEVKAELEKENKDREEQKDKEEKDNKDTPKRKAKSKKDDNGTPEGSNA